MKSFDSYLRKIGGDGGLSFETQSISFENKNRKRFVLLINDLKQCLKAIYENGYDIDKAFQGDWTYEESKYRAIFGKILEPLQPNTVSTSLGSQTPNTIRILELYAGFLLDQEPKASLSTPELLKPDELAKVFSEHNLRKKFEDWLRETRSIAASSIKKYASDGIGSQLSRIAEKDLYSVSSHLEFATLRQKIEAKSEYLHINNEGNGMYSTALNHYSAFLETDPFKRLPLVFQSKYLQGYFKNKQLPLGLLAKPFTILTGASGTGKTKLAISLAKYLSNTDQSNYEIVAVGADWTDNRNVLGFVNHLHPDEAGPRYQSTPILDLLLRASDDSEVPYFLILDEMNLSHVERYFADFLSAMEQKNGPLKLHSESRDLRRSGETEADVPPTLDYPENLFVIGTVNIDETTYMFSPKVLDRANVIEFTVSEEEIGAFLANPEPYPEIETAEQGVAESFLVLAKQAREMGCTRLPEESAAKISRHLLDLFNILKAERFEFAYRTAKEINIYLQVCHHLAENQTDWAQVKPIPLEEKEAGKSNCLTDLDDQILQKLLPKLHGSVGRIGKLLARLAHYCQSGELKADVPTQLDAAAQLEATATTPFPKSLAKLQSMIGTLKEEQFVSFIQ